MYLVSINPWFQKQISGWPTEAALWSGVQQIAGWPTKAASWSGVEQIFQIAGWPTRAASWRGVLRNPRYFRHCYWNTLMPNEQGVRRPLPTRPEGDNKAVRNCDNDLAQYLVTSHFDTKSWNLLEHLENFLKFDSNEVLLNVKRIFCIVFDKVQKIGTCCLVCVSTVTVGLIHFTK